MTDVKKVYPCLGVHKGVTHVFLHFPDVRNDLAVRPLCGDTFLYTSEAPDYAGYEGAQVCHECAWRAGQHQGMIEQALSNEKAANEKHD